MRAVTSKIALHLSPRLWGSQTALLNTIELPGQMRDPQLFRRDPKAWGAFRREAPRPTCLGDNIGKLHYPFKHSRYTAEQSTAEHAVSDRHVSCVGLRKKQPRDHRVKAEMVLAIMEWRRISSYDILFAKSYRSVKEIVR